MSSDAVRIEQVESLVVDTTSMEPNKPYQVVFNGVHLTIVKTEDDIIRILEDEDDNDG